jgi:3-phosphoshikimate 1-carboxyvinyltransferase
VALTIKENEILVPSGLAAPKVPIFGHNDHRIVMAMSTLLSRLGGEILGAEAVKKSFPEYFKILRELKVEVILDETE